MWNLVGRFIKLRNQGTSAAAQGIDNKEESIKTKCNQTINMVTQFYQSRNSTLNEAISTLISLTNKLSKSSDEVVQSSGIFERALCSLCIMVAPFAPHVTSEIWRGIADVSHQETTAFNLEKDVLEQHWPRVMESDTVPLLIKINNTTIGQLAIPIEHRKNEDILKELVLQSPIGQKHLENARIRKVIHTPSARFKGSKVPLMNFILEQEAQEVKNKS